MSKGKYTTNKSGLIANFNKRKPILWNGRNIPSEQHGEDLKDDDKLFYQKQEQEIRPLRIAKVVNKNIEVTYMEKLLPRDITIIVEFSDDTLNLVNPTKVICDTSVLVDSDIEIYYKELMTVVKGKIVKPKNIN